MNIQVPQIVFDSDTSEIKLFVPLGNGTGDHLLAIIPATPLPDADE